MTESSTPRTDAKAEISLDDLGLLDEIRHPGGHLERLDADHIFVEFGDIAVWLRAESGCIATTTERRKPGRWAETRIETLERELAEQKRALSEGSFADGFRAARKLASDIVGAYTDGDCPFDSTIAVMVDKIDRLMPLPEAPK